MDISVHGGEIPIPITSTYTGSHMIQEPPKIHIIPSVPISTNGPNLEDTLPYKKVVRYRECLKNHAAAMGGNATDGCGEFMPNGADGTLDALKCSACNCHRNFHRKDTEGESPSCDCYHLKGRKIVGGKGIMIAGSEAYGYPTNSLIPRPQMIMSYNLGVPSESDEQEGGIVARAPVVKKRFRTKFTQEQKEKMLGFAEKVGWRIQKQEEGVVQQFCQEIGVKRRVLKVWMHNNKHNFAKKSP